MREDFSIAKIYMKFFYTILLFSLILFLPLSVGAQTPGKCEGYQFKVPLFPGACIDNPAEFISFAYQLGLALVVILAMIMIVVGGIQYLTSMGNTSRMSDAKDRITQALLGLILALCSWLILYLINPALIELRWEPSGVEKVVKESLEEIKRGLDYATYAPCGKEVRLYDQWYKITKPSTDTDKEECEKVNLGDSGLNSCINEYQEPSPDFSNCTNYAKFMKSGGDQAKAQFFNDIVALCGSFEKNNCPQQICLGLPCKAEQGKTGECKEVVNVPGSLVCE